jgi:hypothetical protein
MALAVSILGIAEAISDKVMENCVADAQLE